jgi:hypothetical protein
MCTTSLCVQQPWLCATPDGFFQDEQGDLCFLEIKCPFSAKDEPKINVPYVRNNTLVATHAYYTQVQIQMYVANIQKCHFFVYSPADFVHIVIEKDNEFL